MKQKKEALKKQENNFLVASQWQLIRWKFFKHKLAMGALIVLVIFYLSAIFAEFIAPNDARMYNADYKYAPPQTIHFFDEEGNFHLRPFVYGYESKWEPEIYRTIYKEDKSLLYPIYFLVRGDSYKLFGLFPGNIHLFGTKEGKLFLFGTGEFGRCVLSKIIYGGRISLSIGLVGIAISSIIGIIIGGLSGYFGGKIDIFVQRIIEVIISIPTIPLWMALSVALPPFWSITRVYFGITIILSMVTWTTLARVVRGKFLALREEDYVMAARMSGAGEGRIIFRHILPSFTSHIIATLTLSIPTMIIGETTLSFLGLGMRPPAISWGVLLKEAQQIRILEYAPWILLPAVFVVISILAFNFVGDGLRDASDPYSNI